MHKFFILHIIHWTKLETVTALRDMQFRFFLCGCERLREIITAQFSSFQWFIIVLIESVVLRKFLLTLSLLSLFWHFQIFFGSCCEFFLPSLVTCFYITWTCLRIRLCHFRCFFCNIFYSSLSCLYFVINIPLLKRCYLFCFCIVVIVREIPLSVERIAACKA